MYLKIRLLNARRAQTNLQIRVCCLLFVCFVFVICLFLVCSRRIWYLKIRAFWACSRLRKICIWRFALFDARRKHQSWNGGLKSNNNATRPKISTVWASSWQIKSSARLRNDKCTSTNPEIPLMQLHTKSSPEMQALQYKCWEPWHKIPNINMHRRTSPNPEI